MKINLAIIFTLVPMLSYAESTSQAIDWDKISSTPNIEQQIIKQDFIPADTTNNEGFIQNDLAGFDFLNKKLDDRIFYNFKAKVRVLNKYTDKITDYNLKPEESINLKKFDINVKSCADVKINNIENQLAFIEVHKKDKIVFKGWMSNIYKNMNFPEVRELYINLISCYKTELTEESVAIEPVQELLAPTEMKPLKFEN